MNSLSFLGPNMTRYTNVGRKRTHVEAGFDPSSGEPADSLGVAEIIAPTASSPPLIHENEQPKEPKQKKGKREKTQPDSSESTPAVDGDNGQKDETETKPQSKKTKKTRETGPKGEFDFPTRCGCV